MKLNEQQCPISNHMKISHVCLNEFCNHFRLNCFDCHKEGHHCGHHKDQIEIIKLNDFIKSKALEYQNFINKISNLQNQVNQMFDKIKQNIQKKYDISYNVLNQMDIFQVNHTLQNLIKFNADVTPLYEIVSQNSKSLENSLFDFIQVVQLNQKSTPQPQNCQQLANEQNPNNLKNNKQLQNNLIEFVKYFKLSINNSNNYNIQIILITIDKNFDKFKQEITKILQNYNNNYKQFADYALSLRTSGVLRQQFRWHEIFHLFYRYCIQQQHNGITNIKTFFDNTIVSEINTFDNHLHYIYQQKLLIEKQNQFANQNKRQNTPNELDWMDNYYYELYLNFLKFYGWSII